ncbi:TonB-dependent receptor plug domain-containing protein [Tanticharoenia sakaeratensis]|uniref:TonB-dependent receptor n=1 Tax=Tanticharoenia sakaeratensis NBRC 103193 TaxID=1231623 RepID=A0A0D6MK46_9PROT|nr:TonB-dependent receptor [Tanticharoenia sakaeratensis]GAN53810.1 TonB-dependent receptor [Tanticharoenia sakaeratensis NBRC 103193]GBQ22297.1 TonB-dependent outer membrane receptor [Tanticharoenia sakaeratensis NBRC 103193]
MSFKFRLFAATILAVAPGFALAATQRDASVGSSTATHHRTAHKHAAISKRRAITAAPTTAAAAPSGVVAGPVAPAGAPHRRSARDASGDPAEAVIVTGTHAFNRRARDSASPVTVVSAASLRRSGQLNLADAITRVDPSITISAMGNDAGALTSSIRMRGLNPNEVLVLVDGKRRNTTANIYADAGPQQGSTPVDLNMIPASAIDHIEILRDGAAALYGSDAIAGVVNIITKKTSHGINTVAQTGANAYNGDGWQYLVGADGGTALGSDGFVHISGQVYHTDHFVVGSKSTDDHRWTPTSSWPANSNHIMSTAEETRENLSVEWGKDITPGINTYGLITYAHRHSEAYENYRIPTVAPSAYPYGFSPLETIDENDYQANLGVKGDNLFGFQWDLSTLYGADDDDVGNKNTFNPNLYKYTGFSPTTARAESYTLAQWTSNFDMRRNFRIANAVPMTLAMGAEHRLEMYHIEAGNPASYLYGGTQGYAGLTPQNAGSWQRNVWAGYIDGDFHPTRKWDLDFAGRFEHYTDFGNTENGKVTSRYDFTKRIAIRGTISNGFRAPTLPEEHFSSLNVSPTGASGLLSTTSAAGRSIGAQNLKPERSTSAEGGIILEPIDGWHITTDVYQINIRDRIIGSASVNGQTALDAIALTGVDVPTSGGGTFSAANVTADYFANAASTRTQGLDIESDYLLRLHRYGNLNLSMMLNLNRTRIHHVNTDAFGQPLVNEQTLSYLTTGAPRSKIILNALWTYHQWDVNVRETRYGETTSMMTYEDLTPSNLVCPLDGNALKYSAKCFGQFKNTPVWLTDIEVGFRVNDHWHLAVGANNVFNQRPRYVSPVYNYLGPKIYDTNSSGIPMTGGYYYGRVNATF